MLKQNNWYNKYNKRCNGRTPITISKKSDYLYSWSRSWVRSFSRKWTKKELKPQLKQPCQKLLPSKLCILEKWPKWLFITTCEILESGFVKRKGKYGLLMHAFSYFVFGFLSLSLLSFFLLVFSYCYLTVVLLFFSFFFSSSMAAVPLYSSLISWDFSILPLGIHQLFLVYYGHPFRIVHQPIGCPAITTTV